MKLWAFRIIMLATLPVAMPVIALRSFAHELRHALRMTWLDIKLNWYSFVVMMRAGPDGEWRRKA